MVSSVKSVTVFLSSLNVNPVPEILYLGQLPYIRNGSPDIPRDKVSPKNKMSNILFIGNL